MKKFNFLVLLVFCFATSSAQIGIRAGLNLSSLSGDTAFFEDLGAATGFQVGLTYSAALSDKLSIRPGVLYSVKGYQDPAEDFSAAFNYLEIPVDLVFSVYDAAAFGIDIHAGPYFGYMLTGSFRDGEVTEDITFEDEGVSQTDFGLNFGGTIDFGGVYAGLNYGLGIANLVDDEDLTELTLKNTNLSIIAGYMFGGGSRGK